MAVTIKTPKLLTFLFGKNKGNDTGKLQKWERVLVCSPPDFVTAAPLSTSGNYRGQSADPPQAVRVPTRVLFCSGCSTAFSGHVAGVSSDL